MTHVHVSCKYIYNFLPTSTSFIHILAIFIEPSGEVGDRHDEGPQGHHDARQGHHPGLVLPGAEVRDDDT